MKICKKCNKPFNSSGLIDGKHRSFTSRSYCLSCSPFNVKQGYELRKEKTRKLVISGKPCKTCLVCNRDFPWSKNSVCSSCRALYQRWKKKKLAIEILGGKCISCGIVDSDVLTFHHRDRNDKKFELGSFWNWAKWEEVKKEIAKCDLLCFNCHIKLHHNTKDKLNLLQIYYKPKIRAGVTKLADVQDKD